jgi:small subunit ribosomal protein S13
MTQVKQIVRVAKVDIDGNKNLIQALTKIRGVGTSLSSAICNLYKIDQNTKIGSLPEDQVKKLEQAIENPLKAGIPLFMINKKKDVITGKDLHIITSDLKLGTEFDIKRLKKIKSYKGVRHAQGQPVRGQKTKAHFRSGKSVGVKKKKASIKKG